MSDFKALLCLWCDAASNFAATTEKTKQEARLPTQTELEEHWSLIQKFLNSEEAYQQNVESDADSISSYSNAPTNCIDDEMTTKDKSPKAGLAYSSNENDLIWQAYNSEDAPEGRNKALRRIAKQLGRTYNGVRKHIQHLQRKCAPRLKCLKSSESVDSNSGTSDSTSSCFGSRKRSTNLLVATSSSQSAQFTKRIQRGTGYQYTEEEDKAIWTAYLSSTNKRKQDEALRAVALKYGRTFGAVRLHLSIMRDAQYTGIAAAGATSTSHMSSDSEESGSDAGNEVHQVHQVSDLSDSGSEYHSPSAHASQDAQNVPTPTVTAQCGNHYYPPSDSLVKPFTEQPVTSSASVSAWLTSNSREDWQSDRLPVHVPSHTTAVQSPFTPPSANKYGHSEMSLSYYRNTVRPEVYAPETVNATLGGFIKTLRAENMDLIFPPEAHDQRHAQSISHQVIFAAIARARTLLQGTFFHLCGVSNAKLHRVLQLLRVAHCTKVSGGRWAEQKIHLDQEMQSMAVLRRRHDRCLARRMRSEHRAYLANLLLWPLEAELEQVKIEEMEGVRSEVERVLDVLAREPKHTFLR